MDDVERVAQWHPGVMRALSEKPIQTSDTKGLSAVLREWAGNYEEGSFDTEAGLMIEAADRIDALEAILSEKSVQISDYERGQRDMLNAILALNPKAAQRLHMVNGGTEHTFTNHEGRLPFDLVFWVTEVAEQLGIEPKGE
jgi:hypothetical protein